MAKISQFKTKYSVILENIEFFSVCNQQEEHDISLGTILSLTVYAKHPITKKLPQTIPILRLRFFRNSKKHFDIKHPTHPKKTPTFLKTQCPIDITKNQKSDFTFFCNFTLMIFYPITTRFESPHYVHYIQPSTTPIFKIKNRYIIIPNTFRPTAPVFTKI